MKIRKTHTHTHAVHSVWLSRKRIIIGTDADFLGDRVPSRVCTNTHTHECDKSASAQHLDLVVDEDRVVLARV